MPTHFQISVTVTSDKVETLSDIFSELGAHAVTMTDAKDEPLFQLSPDDGPLWQHTTLHALFDETLSAENMIIVIKKNNPEFQGLDFYVEKIAPKNWIAETQKQFQPQQCGALWICPEWQKTKWKRSAHKKEPVVFIEPGLAFGTGTHPTTQLCLTWLSKNAIKNKTVIDYGCGSGILALAANALGAKTVWATDHDHQALLSTENNEKYNAFKNKINIVNTDDIKNVRADIIIANILANTLIDLEAELTSLLSPNGKLILSGILIEDADRVAAVYENNFKHTSTQKKEEWVLMEFLLRA